MSTTHSHQPPIRPAIIFDEWVDAYLGRVARAHGIFKPNRADADRARSSFPISINSQPQATATSHRNILAEVPVWASQKAGATVKYCPACLQQHRYIRAHWRLKSYEVCVKHKLHLKVGLVESSTRNQLNNTRNLPTLDTVTEQQIWNGATCPMPRELRHASLLWSPFEVATACQDDEGRSRALGWATLFDHLINAVVTDVDGSGSPLRRVSSLWHRSEWMESAELNVPSGIEELPSFICSIRRHVDRRAAAKCLAALARQERKSPTLLSALPLQLAADQMMAMAPGIAAARFDGPLPSEMHPDGYVSAAHAAFITGCYSTFFDYLVRVGFFRDVKRIKHERTTYTFIALSEIHACRRWMQESMSVELAMDMLKVDRAGYLALADNNLLVSVRIDRWVRYRQSSIWSTLNHFQNVALPISAARSPLLPLSFCWRNRSRGHRAIAAALIHEISCGEIPVFRSVGADDLREYFVDVRCVKRDRELTGMYYAESMNRGKNLGQMPLLEAIS